MKRRRGLIAFSCVLLACRAEGERFRPLVVGEPAPEYTVRTLAGDTARVTGSQPLTLLHVWATWCLPCEKEFPDIEALHREFGPRGLRVLAVSVDNGGDDPVEEYVREKGATFTIGRDPDGIIRRRYQGFGVPESYLIAPNGTLLWRQIGAMPEGGGEARKAIAEALESER